MSGQPGLFDGGIQAGSRVRVEGFWDLKDQVGTVRAIDRGRAHIVWDRAVLGVSWLPVETLILIAVEGLDVARITTA